MNRGVVVTGASTGFGAAIARHLAGRGFRVFGTVRRAEDEVALARDGVTVVRMDVTDTASIARAREQVERALAGAPLEGLVNNAGIPAAGPLELFPLDELRRAFEVNLIGTLAVTQAFLPLLKVSRGRIVNISSIAGRGALPFMGPYAASKFALEAISDSLRRELLPFGVRVIVIEPGSFKTAIWSKVEAMDVRRYAGTPYESVLDRFRRAVLRGAERAPPPDKVVRSVWRALNARRPPLRVIVSPHGWLDRIPLWIPDRWLDWLIHRFLWRGVRLPPS
ncbi:MAG TPA: SDR family oxidoreductase [Gemmatimonadales bacterium]|nr:SDR family oxidoreductase [Gemmatimonadales bacterium]